MEIDRGIESLNFSARVEQFHWKSFGRVLNLTATFPFIASP